MSTERKVEDTQSHRINPRDILMEEDALLIRYQWEWLMLEEAKKKVIHTLKTKYCQYDL